MILKIILGTRHVTSITSFAFSGYLPYELSKWCIDYEVNTLLSVYSLKQYYNITNNETIFYIEINMSEELASIFLLTFSNFKVLCINEGNNNDNNRN